MHITANSLYHDTINFLRKKKIIVCIIVLFASSITVTLDNILNTNSDILKIFYESKMHQYYSIFDFIKTLTLSQQKKLLFYSMMKLFSSLVGTTVLIGILEIFIKSLSFKNQILSLEFKKNIPYLFINIFILMFIITTVVQLGFVFLVVPGIIAFVFFSLSPIILVCDNKTIIQSIFSSFKITFQNFKTIFPAIMLWILFKLVVLMLFLNIKIVSESFALFLLNVMINFISAALIIYLFRFYMLFSSSRNLN
ncbi:hypothetical protein XW81_01295 [Buchnera aphidicola (Schlechtendalia chinensis)]|uniref:UPF0259 membrane protein XW81_01295 n=2 Tax=Buchnera aphidicola TaxID=9 RepID=A0A172WDK1_BUCSC|nr:YciC family protein [Buchnera aphidicola]ANF17041.1 hypothetical protein XW81_01295 [Buchnera aphidicola (Schlechtendalia chinensis)]